MEIISKNGGRKAVQINSLREYFNTGVFESHYRFKREFPRCEFSRGRVLNLKIYPVMDTDDCDRETLEMYKSRKLFQDSPFADHIVPIYNTPNLDSVLIASGYNIDTGKKCESYEDAFPVRSRNRDSFNKLVRSIPEDGRITNIHVLLEHCLKERYREK
ncbi:MAG: hypothetical protein LBG62_04170 [Candidatus Methanoplasma sp.]|jgi:hypothetical protein|nr:hypothetical protein [Candidatus Methanoplasma sp.]